MSSPCRTLLVVDDDPGIRDIVTRRAGREGFRVLQAENAEIALAILDRDDSVCLVLTDLTMPGRNGEELVREIQTSKPRVKVMLMSGSKTSAKLDPAVAFIEKPFTLDELMRELLTVSGTVPSQGTGQAPARS